MFGTASAGNKRSAIPAAEFQSIILEGSVASRARFHKTPKTMISP
jgi:hypothetical protein